MVSVGALAALSADLIGDFGLGDRRSGARKMCRSFECQFGCQGHNLSYFHPFLKVNGSLESWE